MTRPFRLMRIVRHWHARLGALSALLLLILAVTGVVLNHTDSLKLGQTTIKNRLLMAWYGLETRTPSQGFLLPGGYFTWQDGVWVMDGRVVARHAPTPVGAVRVSGLRYVASAGSLTLYQDDGQKVETLDRASLPATPLLAIGQLDEQVAIHTGQGNFVSSDGFDWHQISTMLPNWSKPDDLTPDTQRQLFMLLAPGVSLERFLLDLHSGRLFGAWGPWLMDLVALILIGLAASGSWFYWRSMKGH